MAIRLQTLATSTSSQDEAPDTSIKNSEIGEHKNRATEEQRDGRTEGDDVGLQPELMC